MSGADDRPDGGVDGDPAADASAADGDDGDPLAALRARLRSADATVATAEAATGGSLGARLTARPGASDFYEGGVVAYAYDTKRRLLGVRRETLDEHGVVAAPTATEMARGVRDRFDATWGLATTGVAGPGGGTGETPVGTAFVAVAHAAPWETGDSYARVERFAFDGDRERIRRRTVDRALAVLTEEIGPGRAGGGR